MSPTLSIIIVTYNWLKWLDKCLTSIFAQTYAPFEVILVDNWSSDETQSFVTKRFPLVKYILSPTNLWFAWGNNLGIAQAQGNLILLLNNDTRVDSDFLEKYINIYETAGYDILWVTEKPYEVTQKRTSWPISLTVDRFWHHFIDRTEKKLFYTNWACILCTKQVYIATWWLDDNFFMYCEEVDRQWRSRLYGYTTSKTNEVYIYHAGAWSSSWNRLNYTTFLRRNQNTPQMLIKNYRWWNLCRVLPCYMCINIIEMLVFFSVWKWKIAYSYLQGRWYVICSLRWSLIPKRKIIQAKRVVGDKEIMKHMYHWSAKIHHLYSYLQKS
jgi:GT2 family glycosyltransferase